MLRWAVIFLVIALVAALLGFTNIAGGALAIAQILFFIFLAIFVVLLVMGLMAGLGRSASAASGVKDPYRSDGPPGGIRPQSAAVGRAAVPSGRTGPETSLTITILVLALP